MNRRRVSRLLQFTALSACAMIVARATAVEPTTATSQLWGVDGERWSPTSRLPDFSFAGYHRGEKPLPDVKVTHSVKDFGAAGDGTTDDTEAFKRAIAAAASGAILIPNGRYVITDILEIRKPNIVLRGESRDGAVLYFPKTLTDVRPNWGATTTGQRTSNYSWSGGFVWVRGSRRSEKIADVIEPVPRGEKSLTLGAAHRLAVGQEVELRQRDTADQSLARHVYSEQPGDIANLRDSARTSLVARVVRVDGDRVTLDRAVRTDVRVEWNPALYPFAPNVTEVGIENLTFEFPVTDYRGHFTELGNNPIAFNDVAHGWIRNIRLVNPDSGPFVSGHFCTVEGVVYESQRKPDPTRNSTGHHGLTFGGGDNLFTNFDIRMQFQHDITMAAWTSGNVVANGRGVDICFDHHRRGPHENLFTNIDVGVGTHVWRCGGGAGLGLHAAARTTFWNIRSARPVPPPPPQYGPASINVIGLTTTAAPQMIEGERWFEVISPDVLQPQNLHEAQRARRFGRRDDGASATREARR